MLLRPRILFYFIFDIKTFLWLTPAHIIRPSWFPISRLPIDFMARNWHPSQIPNSNPNPYSSPHPLSYLCVCVFEHFRSFLLFYFELWPLLFHFRLCNEFNSQLYIFFFFFRNHRPKFNLFSSSKEKKVNRNWIWKVPKEEDCRALAATQFGHYLCSGYANLSQPQSHAQLSLECEK